MPNYYDRDGEPMTMMAWAERFEDPPYKRVAFDSVGDVEISTVWLGLDHNFGDGPPMIFETMIFGAPDGGEHTRRYSTEDEARSGHMEALAWVNGLSQSAF